MEDDAALRHVFFARVVDQWRAIERRMGVGGVVRVGTTPSRCPYEEIAKLFERTDRDGVIRLGPRPTVSSRHDFAPGAAVAIVDGPLRGFNGLYAGQTTRERELVLIDLLGRQTPVQSPLACSPQRNEPAGARRPA
jgi:transcription antitermination factor NusG